jgi:hypothetical protein
MEAARKVSTAPFVYAVVRFAGSVNGLSHQQQSLLTRCHPVFFLLRLMPTASWHDRRISVSVRLRRTPFVGTRFFEAPKTVFDDLPNVEPVRQSLFHDFGAHIFVPDATHFCKDNSNDKTNLEQQIKSEI